MVHMNMTPPLLRSTALELSPIACQPSSLKVEDNATILFYNLIPTLCFSMHQSAFVPFSTEMELQDPTQRTGSKRCRRNRDAKISFSAKLPNDVRGVFADSICAVKYSTNPFSDIRDSILEMLQSVGVQDWKEMEELIYCYIALNSSEIHNVIQDAFLSLLFPSG